MNKRKKLIRQYSIEIIKNIETMAMRLLPRVAHRNRKDLQERGDCWHGHTGANNKERSWKCFHGCSINGTVHWPVDEWHQRFADAKQRIHFSCVNQ